MLTLNHVRFDVTTHASPEQVRRALTDFSDRRLQIWNRTLDPTTYEVRELGDSWAVARESTPRSPFWVVARYDWSDPTVVRWTLEETSYGGHGTGSARIGPTAEAADFTSTGATPTSAGHGTSPCCS